MARPRLGAGERQVVLLNEPGRGLELARVVLADVNLHHVVGAPKPKAHVGHLFEPVSSASERGGSVTVQDPRLIEAYASAVGLNLGRKFFETSPALGDPGLGLNLSLSGKRQGKNGQGNDGFHEVFFKAKSLLKAAGPETDIVDRHLTLHVLMKRLATTIGATGDVNANDVLGQMESKT